ncbi:hypothetical protein LSAT2_027582 [Lamellibrachia satsuma]|nr:hypothetical protein LSAT2_027582 [Lamellibrachia satsuma]
MALELTLQALARSPEFNMMKDKNWNAISKMIPGSTPRQCIQRYETLLKELVASNFTTIGKSSPEEEASSREAGAKSNEASSSPATFQPPSAKTKGLKTDKDVTSSKSNEVIASSSDTDLGPVMVIHVCDEAKNLKQDFNCQRDLLVSEMRYFAEYLSTDAHRWEEVDISVHCDVQIFDWLMKFVKRSSHCEEPKLETSNVVSILISSDFLKMDRLVKQCVEFCHKNLSAIISTPCNMNCINDKLVSRFAELFTHSEADSIRDRKDKFKSKLFSKLLERLFDPNAVNLSSPESAATLYRCSVCKKLLTKNLQSKLACDKSRMTVDLEGQLTYSHMRDPEWDINDFLIELKCQLHTWRDVYWRVWGIINYLQCARCGEHFPCTNFGHCLFHPIAASFDGTTTTPLSDGSTVSLGSAAVGHYVCCNQVILRFDPTQTNTGCKAQDHLVKLEQSTDDSLEPKLAQKYQVYNDMLTHRDVVCQPFRPQPPSQKSIEKVNVFMNEELPGNLRWNLGLGFLDTDVSHTNDPTKSEPRLQPLTVEKDVSVMEDSGNEEELGEEEEPRATHKVRPKRSLVTVADQAILVDPPDFSTTKMRKWDSSRSLRWNQDAQREEDQRRMKEIVTYLTQLRLNTERLEKIKQKEFGGGIFSKLLAQWHMTYNIQPPMRSNTSVSSRKTKVSTMK